MKTFALVCLLCGVATADTFKTGKLTYVGKWDKQSETWTTTLEARDEMQFDPHHDVINYFSKAGFKIAKEGIYIRGESIADPVEPSLAIALPLKAGAEHEVKGMIPTTYKVLSHAPLKTKAGTFDAWKIEISDTPNGKGYVWLAPGTGIVKIQLPTGRVDELVKIE